MIKFRASSVGNLMVKPTSEHISKGAETYVKEVWLHNNFNYRQNITSKYMEKGLLMENDSIELLSRVDDKFYIKNEVSLENKVLTGTCDINDSNIIDIKTSWDIKTFMDAKLTSVYEWQLRAYMELYDKDSSELVYCLLDATPEMVTSEQQKAFYKYNNLDEDFQVDEVALKAYEQDLRQIESNLVIGSKLNDNQRVKRFIIERDLEKTKLMYAQIEKANIFYNSITL